MNGGQQGPVPTTGIVNLLNAGAISAGSQVWKEGMPEWLPLSDTKLSAHVESGGVSDGSADFEEYGKKAYNKTKVAVGNAMEAMKILFSDPMGGQKNALDLMGEAKALQAGIVFTVLFVIVSYMLVRSMMTFGMGMPFGKSIEVIFASFVPAVALAGSFFGIGKISGGKISFHTSVFVAGVALLPITSAIFASWLIGIGNLELICVISFFCTVITVLLLNASLVDVQGLSTRKAVLLTPAMMLVAAYLAKVILVAMWQGR